MAGISTVTQQRQGRSGRVTWRAALGTGIVIVLLSPLAVVALVWRYDTPAPVVESSLRVGNPAGTFIAVLEKIDAMDVNAGELHVVHVLRRGGLIDESGNSSKTMIFYIDATEPPPRVRWIDNGRLSISYVGGTSAPVKRSLNNGVVVSYRQLDAVNGLSSKGK